jgi:spermidine synthase
MPQSLKSALLPFTVFITGACVLIVEVVATRVLSPFYGNTIFTVSSVISVILAALSVGYYAGGKLADKKPSLFWFFSIILLSGIVLLAFNYFGMLLLPILASMLSLSEGPLISSIILFFTPALLLGTLSPFAVKLQSVNFPKQGLGTVAGKIFFWSTLGSIAGSLSAGFWLIPHFGINQIIVATGIVLFFLGFIPILIMGKKKRALSLLALAVFSVISFIPPVKADENILYSKDGVYEKITVYDGKYDGRPARFFQQDRSASGAMFLDSGGPKDLVYEYTKYYSVYKAFNPDVESALIIGGGAYSIPKAVLSDLPNANVDVSEIEPSLFNLAKKYFGLKDNPRLHNYTEDGRQLLKNSSKNYDLIFSDVYYSVYSIPAHFTTQEFFSIAKQKLSPEGIFIANLIGDLSRQKPSFIMSEIKTFQNVFSNSYFFALNSPESTQPQNFIFVGYNSESQINLNSPQILNSQDPIIKNLSNKLINTDRFDLSSYPILTDDYSPVEYLTGKFLKRSATSVKLFDGQEMLSVIEQELGYGPRYITADGHKKIQDFLVAEMSALASQVKTQPFIHTESNGTSYQLINIIASFNPENPNRIILTTHYDSQKISFNNLSNQNQPSPGANNSASGVAVLVEFARALHNSAVKPNTGIDIVFFDGEEGEESQGGDFTNWQPLGSAYFAQHLSDFYGDKKPASGIVLDMVCDKDLKIYKEISSAKEAPSQTEKFWDIAQKIDSSVFKNEASQEIRDDHTSLNQAGIPSFLVIDYDYPYYATTGDTLDKCSDKSLETVFKALWDYVMAL